MHILICILLGGMVAWGVCRKAVRAQSGDWTLRAGMVGAAFPFLDVVFVLLDGVGGLTWPARFGLLWTPLLAPFYAAMLATVLAMWTKRAWPHLFTAALAGLLTSILLTLLTVRGIEVLPFMASWRLGLGLVHAFDYVLLGIGALILALGLVLGGYKRDIARVGMFLVLVYVLGVGYVQFAARQVGHDYARALQLEVAAIYALPQPLSPFNWRVIVRTSDEVLHDTLIHLYRSDELVVAENSTRAWRIQALYKPVNQAVWRGYERLSGQQLGGGKLSKAQQRYAVAAWRAVEKSDVVRALRFAVLTGFTLPPTAHIGQVEACAQFKDLRFEGARRQDRGVYLVCGSRDWQRFMIFSQIERAKEGQPARFSILHSQMTAE